MREEENRRQSEMRATDKLTYLLIGGGIGAVVALLFAPKSGAELREDIADTTRKGVDMGRERATQIGERAGEYYEVARERAGEYYGAATTRAGELADRARGAAGQPRNTLSAAIDAGKQAYYEEKRRTESASISEGRPTYPKELGESGENES
ncbi:MAG: YtxH domain-containing protein [Acidobacteriota bacterium]|nr:YtxH domain-containing protein [Acidobacteriota bacterium]